MFKSALWLFGVTLIVLVLFLPSYTKMQELRDKNEQYKRQIEDLKKEQVRLEQEEKRLKEDPEYLEKVARERMGLIRKGETMYKVVPEQ